MTSRPLRPIATAVLLAVGSELTTGETRDSNGGELAASLAGAGVTVRRITALPDDLAAVSAAFADALDEVDLVVSTGGLGPTPDDLTREAVAGAIGETPAIDPELEAWLRGLFDRRGMALPVVNLKQAWLIPSATGIPNANGTAPGWWVDRPDGRVIVLLPGPPREMRPMWTDWALPRLRERGLGDGRIAKTLRTYGIGESSVVERLGEPLFRTPNPVVATYARAEWLDIRISAVDEAAFDATSLIATAEAAIRAGIPGHVWAEGETSWSQVVGAAAEAAGVRFATVETGTGGSLAALLGDVPALAEAVIRRPGDDVTGAGLAEAAELRSDAARAATDASVPLGLAVEIAEAEGQTIVRAAIGGPWTSGEEVTLDLRLFSHGAYGRLRAAVATAAFLVERLRERAAGTAREVQAQATRPADRA
jgi:nicotinamide-nucleotide amidase